MLVPPAAVELLIRQSGALTQEVNELDAATPRRMISITCDFARSKALSSSGLPPFRVDISCAAVAYCWVVAQIM